MMKITTDRRKDKRGPRIKFKCVHLLSEFTLPEVQFARSNNLLAKFQFRHLVVGVNSFCRRADPSGAGAVRAHFRAALAQNGKKN